MKYLQNQKSFLGRIKGIFYHVKRAFRCKKLSQNLECAFEKLVFLLLPNSMLASASVPVVGMLPKQLRIQYRNIVDVLTDFALMAALVFWSWKVLEGYHYFQSNTNHSESKQKFFDGNHVYRSYLRISRLLKTSFWKWTKFDLKTVNACRKRGQLSFIYQSNASALYNAVTKLLIVNYLFFVNPCQNALFKISNGESESYGTIKRFNKNVKKQKQIKRKQA